MCYKVDETVDGIEHKLALIGIGSCASLQLVDNLQDDMIDLNGDEGEEHIDADSDEDQGGDEMAPICRTYWSDHSKS